MTRLAQALLIVTLLAGTAFASSYELDATGLAPDACMRSYPQSQLAERLTVDAASPEGVLTLPLDSEQDYALMVQGSYAASANADRSEGFVLNLNGFSRPLVRSLDGKYCLLVRGDGLSVNLAVGDVDYSDNSGSLRVEILRR